MLRVSKITDYATVIMAFLASEERGTCSAKAIALGTHISLPMVSKILKLLAQHGFLVSHKGARGGYGMIQLPEDISLGRLVQALEGDVAMTTCSSHGYCEVEATCQVRDKWMGVSQIVYDTLAKISLADMMGKSHE